MKPTTAASEGRRLARPGTLCGSRASLAALGRAVLAAAAASLVMPAALAESPLADALMNDDRALIARLIEAGADVDAAQGDGTTPLHWAVYRLDPALVALLLERGAAPDAINAYGSSPLAEAVKAADTGLVRMLLDAGADVESPNADGQTALMLAARAGSIDVARLLVERGADVDAKESWRGQTALMWAADARQPAIVELLIEHGADVDGRAIANDWAVQVTSEPRAQYRPTGGLTALGYAARASCTGCVAALLDAGADVDRPNPDGVTPLMLAIDNLGFDAARLLLERGANPHLWDWWGRTALYVAVDMSSFSTRRGTPEVRGETSAADIVDLLLSMDVNPNAQLNMHRPGRGGNSSRFVDDVLMTGATPLLRAAIGHDVVSVRALLEHGAQVDLPNAMGVTPLMAAAGVGVSERDRRLDYSGDVESRSVATLEVLIAAGADVDARMPNSYNRTGRIARPSTLTDREGQTALYGAIKWGWRRVVEFLLANGADVDTIDAHGMSPLDQALGRTGGRDNVVSEEIAALLRGD